MSNHVFGKNEYGTACVRCGYFNSAMEAIKPCSGRFDERLLVDLQAQIDQASLKIKLINEARQPKLSV